MNDEMKRAAAAFREAANNPAGATTLSPLWIEGFTDGLQFSAAVLDVLAEGKPTPEAVEAALTKMGTEGFR